MENISETPNERKSVIKAKSFNSGPPRKLRNEPVKRKSFNVNEAVRSLDLALGRLKKSKLVNGAVGSGTAHIQPIRQSKDMFTGSLRNPSNITDVDNASLISMNFSQYELMRNLSRSNCNLDGGFSSTTCEAYSSISDIACRDEQLERYFRSVDMWSRNHREAGPSDTQNG